MENPENKESAASEENEQSAMRRVQELLFGQQYRDFEKKIKDTESRISKAGIAQQKMLLARLDAMESMMFKKFHALSEKIDSEAKDRKSDSSKNSSRAEQMERIQALDRQNASERFEGMSAFFSGQLRAAEIKNERALNALNVEKVDKDKLAKIFAESADVIEGEKNRDRQVDNRKSA